MAAPMEHLERELVGLLHDARTTNSLAVAGLTLVLIEHLANFRDEVDLVWKTRLSLSSVFYIWIRYFTLVVLCADVSFMLRGENSDRMPIFFLRTNGDFNRDNHLRRSHLGFTVHILFAPSMKFSTQFCSVWILYGRKWRLLYFLIPLIAAEMIAMISVGTFTIASLEKYLHIGPILDGCYSLKVPRLFTFYAVPPFVTAVIMFLMTLHKCGATCLSLGPGRTPIIALFFRDGVFWFLALVLVSVVEIVLWDRARPTLAQIPVVPAISLIAVIGARVVLNIKHVASSADMDMGVATVGEPETDTVPARRERTERIPWYLKTNDTANWGGPSPTKTNLH
ncbi:hypothetical protein C8F04DRAFT_597904 [Mycena alexandri]|uniref:DUF6533 domain-containing protein n=1 Tax=Mycena alexandri TaxID=1745969 RepID=A0AAD6TE61_9AGAR|nr:hypothetical protein C8F04DRAFT_597904 [Mycena alexandri]